jgi:zinc transport system substrate-binding protein
MDVPNRSFMIFHPSWGYFAKDYNLTQIAIEVEGKEPTLQSLAHTIEEAKEENIKTVFVSLGFSSKAAEIITKEIGGKTEVLDPLAENYIENLKITANKIKNQ